MELQARLVHAEPGSRVVRVSAREGERCLGSALGEAADAEQAEERALTRLLARLGSASPAPPKRHESAAGPTPTTPTTQAPPKPEPKPEPEPEPKPEPESGSGSGSGPPMAETASAQEPPADPEDWSDELARIDLQLQRLGWSREKEGTYLERAFGHPSRSRLTSWADLKDFLRALEGFAPGLDPASAPVPLRRAELLRQCDLLLAQLGWSTAQARSFLAQELAVSSRSLLSDEQLLAFNLLLESELLRNGADPEVTRPLPPTTDPETATA